MSQTVVALVGRPNVGKSTLFNRLTKSRKAIVEDTPGVTRDRNYGIARHVPYEFIVVDTGGFDFGETSELMSQMKQQAQLAIEEADVIVFVTDVRQGWMPDDQEIYQLLMQSKKPLFLAVNKVDEYQVEQQAYEFYESGIETFYPVSAQHKRGIEHLLEEINEVVSLMPEEKEESEDSALKIALVGKANVGKSSLINTFLGEERMVVDDFAGTTRDSVDNRFSHEDEEYVLVDTAGIRRKSKVSHKLETFSIISSLKSIENADIAVLVMDASEGVTTQVMKVANYIEYRKKGLVLVINKSDLLKTKQQKEAILQEVEERLHFIDYAPVLMVSAETGESVFDILKTARQVYENGKYRVGTSDFNRVLQMIVQRNPPPAKAGRPTKIYYGNQAQSGAPTFVMFSNHPDKIKASYTQYMIHQLRYHFGFVGNPVEIIWKSKKK